MPNHSRRPTSRCFRIAYRGALLLVLAGCTATSGELEPAAAPPVDPELIEQALDLAARAISEERVQDARQILDRILISVPDHPEGRLLRAEADLASGDIAKAVAAFQAVVEVEEVRTRALQGKGISLLLIGDAETGVRSLQEAVAEGPHLWRAWSALGVHYDGQQDWTAAANAYDAAVDAKPDAALIYNNRGFHYLLQRRVPAAIADFSRALELNPDFEPAELNLRIALAWAGEYGSSVSGLQESELPEALNNAGYIATLRGDYVDAESLLLRSIEADYGFNRTARRNLDFLDGVRGLDGVSAPEDAPIHGYAPVQSIEVE